MGGLLEWIAFTVGMVLAGAAVFAMIISPLLSLVFAAAAGMALWVSGLLVDEME